MRFSNLNAGTSRQLLTLAYMMKLQARILRNSGHSELGWLLARRAQAIARSQEGSAGSAG